MAVPCLDIQYRGDEIAPRAYQGSARLHDRLQAAAALQQIYRTVQRHKVGDVARGFILEQVPSAQVHPLQPAVLQPVAQSGANFIHGSFQLAKVGGFAVGVEQQAGDGIRFVERFGYRRQRLAQPGSWTAWVITGIADEGQLRIDSQTAPGRRTQGVSISAPLTDRVEGNVVAKQAKFRGILGPQAGSGEMHRAPVAQDRACQFRLEERTDGETVQIWSNQL